MLQNTIRVSFFIISWLTLLFLPNKKKLVIKYLPVSLFSTMNVIGEIFFFSTHKLWKVKGGPKQLTNTAALLVFGPYLVLNLWMFYLSKGKFIVYCLLNLVGDLLYAFPIVAILKKLNVFNIKVKSINFFLLIFINALLNFGFQKIIEKIYPQTRENIKY